MRVYNIPSVSPASMGSPSFNNFGNNNCYYYNNNINNRYSSFPPKPQYNHTFENTHTMTPTLPSTLYRGYEAGHQNHNNMVCNVHHQQQSESMYRQSIIHELRSSNDQEILLEEQDVALLSDYMLYVMQQLKVCHFVKTDRKSRGGKRDNIAVGFAGIQCKHCQYRSGGRKFFWSDVDRFANSFAEIPSHVMKCRECPTYIKQNLALLKSQHSVQQARLPRGSQKVFFRRMFRRIHGVNNVLQTKKSFEKESTSEHVLDRAGGDNKGPAVPKNSIIRSEVKCISPPHTPPVYNNTVPRPCNNSNGRILLGINEDSEWLSDMDCFVRRSIEIFAANENDIRASDADDKHNVTCGQIGMRCVHCACTTEGAKGNAVFYPPSIDKIYDSVQQFHKGHLASCENMSHSASEVYFSTSKHSSDPALLHRYYNLSAKVAGLRDTFEGIRFEMVRSKRLMDNNVADSAMNHDKKRRL